MVDVVKFSIYRSDAATPTKPAYMQPYQLIRSEIKGKMVLDALLQIQAELDPTLAFRKSCREGVCGSDGMNINGKNSLACTIPLSNFEGQTITIKPLPGFKVIRDLIVDLTEFFAQYAKIKPYLQNDQPLPNPTAERPQSIEQRAKLDGLYECILCACCSSACPIYLHAQNQFVGPAAMLQAARFILDSRDDQTLARIEELEQGQSLFKCQNILTCVDACPKGLDPNKAIHAINAKIIEDQEI